MDTKFSVATHILILISEADKDINSRDIAESVGTNASYIRKICALLKKANVYLDNVCIIHLKFIFLQFHS